MWRGTDPGLLPGFSSLTNGDIGNKRKMIKRVSLLSRCFARPAAHRQIARRQILRGCYRATFAPDDLTGQPFAADAIISNPPAFAHVHVAEALGVPLTMSFSGCAAHETRKLADFAALRRSHALVAHDGVLASARRDQAEQRPARADQLSLFRHGRASDLAGVRGSVSRSIRPHADERETQAEQGDQPLPHVAPRPPRDQLGVRPVRAGPAQGPVPVLLEPGVDSQAQGLDAEYWCVGARRVLGFSEGWLIQEAARRHHGVHVPGEQGVQARRRFARLPGKGPAADLYRVRCGHGLGGTGLTLTSIM